MRESIRKLIQIAAVLNCGALLGGCTSGFAPIAQPSLVVSSASANNPPAGHGVPSSSSTPAPAPTPVIVPKTATDVIVTSPASGASVSGVITVTGVAGSSIANIATFADTGAKIASDAAPVAGAFSFTLDTTQLPNGKATISVIGFTVTSGSQGGAKITTTLALQVANGGSVSQGSSTPTSAISAGLFLKSLGICVHTAQGVPADSYTQPLKYLGVRNVRDDLPGASQLVSLHQQTGVMVNIITSGDLGGSIAAAKMLASAGALLSIEGWNEANNFPQTYNGQLGGGSGSWLPVAQFQSDLYKAVHADAQLASFPVFSPSEAGAESPNVGLQFLKIPAGANTLMPDGTVFSDFANVHNYVSGRGNLVDNMAWNAADATLAAQWDGIFGEYGQTWGGQFLGYSKSDLLSLPKVTTETGWDSSGNSEDLQGKLLLNTYLAQFKRGFKYTFVYQLRDGEGGGGAQGLFHPDSSPKAAANYIHNMTTLLADDGMVASPAQVSYSFDNQPATVHDLLLQKSTGALELIVWDERVSDSDMVNLNLGSTFSSVTVFDPTQGTSPMQTLSGVSSLSLKLTDHPVIIELKK